MNQPSIRGDNLRDLTGPFHTLHETFANICLKNCRNFGKLTKIGAYGIDTPELKTNLEPKHTKCE